MPNNRQKLRMVLIQVRDLAIAAEQELGCFLARCRMERHQVRTINLVDEPRIRWRHVAAADVVMVGGAGSHTVTEEYPFTAPLMEVLARLLDERRPFFGSCWGHQLMVQVLGGTVVTDLESKEVGTFEISVTEEGLRDPLLSGLPDNFTVQLGHKDRVEQPPAGIEVLARSERCSHQLIRIQGKPAYGSQFHSEMSDDDMRERLRMYQRIYLGNGSSEVAAFERSLRPSPVADGLLDRFLTLYT